MASLNMKGIWNDFLSLLFPVTCWGCERVLEEEALLCASCQDRLPFWDTHGNDLRERFPKDTFASATAYAVFKDAFVLATAHAVCKKRVSGKRSAARPKSVVQRLIHAYAAFKKRCFDKRDAKPKSVIQRLIHAFKYYQRLYVGDALAQACAMRVRKTTALSPCDLIIPVPLHWLRYWSRGFNQSEIIARHFSEILDIPLCKDSLVRKKYTSSQVGKTPEARRKSMVGKFAVKTPGRITEQRILLVDDVVTTGSTVLACAETLKAAGAKEISLCALAATC